MDLRALYAVYVSSLKSYLLLASSMLNMEEYLLSLAVYESCINYFF